MVGAHEDLVLSLATHVQVASLSIDDSDVNRTIGRAIAAHGGIDGFAAHVLTGRYLEQELQARGFDGIQAPLPSLDDVRRAVRSLQQDGFSSMLADASAVLSEPIMRLPSSQVSLRWDCQAECEAYLAAAHAALVAAGAVCAILPGPPCAAAMGAAIGLYLHAHAICAICGL